MTEGPETEKAEKTGPGGQNLILAAGAGFFSLLYGKYQSAGCVKISGFIPRTFHTFPLLCIAIQNIINY